MDANIESKVRELADLILQSQAYQNYKMSSEQIKANPELYSTVNEYRRRNFYLQTQGDPSTMYEEIGKLEEGFSQHRKIKLVHEFLQNELYLCRMIRKIDELLIEDMEFELDFF